MAVIVLGVCMFLIHLFIPLHIHMSPCISIHPPIYQGDIGSLLFICQTFLCLSVHPFIHQFIHCLSATVQLWVCHTSWSTSLLGTCSLMYGWLRYLCILGTVLIDVLQSVWTGGLWMYAKDMCYRLVLIVLFLCSVFIMSQVSATMSTTTTPTCNCCMFQYFVPPHDCYHGPHVDGATSNIVSAWCGAATTVDTEEHKTCCWPCHCATAATWVPNASSGLCKLCHEYFTGKFLFKSWASHQFHYMYWYLFCCMLSAFRYHAGCHIHQWELNLWDLHHCNLLEHTHGRHMYSLVMVIGPCQECTEWLLPLLLWVGESLLLLSQLCSSHSNYMVEHTALGLGRESPYPSAFPTCWGGVFFSEFVSIWWHVGLWICGGH